MVRQYIGARYVPKFYQNSLNPLSNEWEENVTYEALTVVTYLNDSYTSKKPVPITVGNPRNNPEYWSLSGAYNAQVEEYRREVIDALQQFEGIEEDIVDINNNIGTLTDLTTEDKTSIVNAINEINANTQTSTKNIIFVSDSYGLNRNGNNGVGYYINSLIRSGDSFVNWSNGSTGIVCEGDGGYTALTLMQSRALQIEDPDSITDVVIAMGANDIANATKSQIVDATVVLSNYIKATYPNAKQWISFYGLIENLNSANFTKYLEAVDAYRRAAGYTYFQYMSNLEYIMHNHNHFQSDGVHPTSEGCLQLARGVVAWIYNNGYDYLFETIESYSDGGLTGSFKITINNGITSINISEYGGTKSMSLSASLTDVGNCLNSVKGFAGNGVIALIPMYGVSGFPCVSLILAGSKIYMQIPSASAVSVTAITCKLATLTIDTLTA